MYVNTKTRLLCDLLGPKLRLLFEGGFYTRLYGNDLTPDLKGGSRLTTGV